jgi:Domain of unknown function DUF11/PASTA domain
LPRFRMAAVLAAVATVLAVPSAHALTIGDLPASGATNQSCGPFTVWQMVPSSAQSGAIVVTGWETYQRAGATGRTARLKVLHPTGAHAWKVVGESPVLDVGTTDGVKSQAVSISVAGGDFVALFANNADCYFTESSTRQLDGNSATEPAVGDTIGDSAGPSPAGYALDLKLTAEPDADGDGFGDDTQDSCPEIASIHTGPCVTDPSVTASVTPATIGVGDLAVMTGTVSGGGPGAARNAVLHLAATTGLDFVSSLPSAGCAFTNDLACPLGTLATNGSVPFVAVMKGTSTGAKTLTASIATSDTDSNPANNSAAGTVTVEQRVPLVCTVPSLKGLTKAVAKRLLEAVHCKLGKATKKKAKKGKRGTVIKQAKKVGTVLPVDSKVNVTLKK